MNVFRRIVLLCLFLPLIPINFYAFSFFSYDNYYVGAKANGMGGAYTSIADDPSAVFWNPAGIVQQKSPVLSYLLDSQFILNDIRDPLNSVFKVTYKVPALVNFIYPVEGHDLAFAISATTPFQRKIDADYYLVQIAPTVAYMPVANLSMAITPGLLVSQLGKDTGFGWDMQAGLLWFITPDMQAGLNYRSAPSVTWTRLKLDSIFPWDLQGGISFKIAWNLIFAADVEYIGWKDISFKENGIELAPRLKSGLFYDIHPKFGVMYTDEGSGAHLRFGLNSSSFLDTDGLSPQYHLTLGLGGKALRIIEIEASISDSYLFSFFNRQQRVIEIIQIGIEYKFE